MTLKLRMTMTIMNNQSVQFEMNRSTYPPAPQENLQLYKQLSGTMILIITMMMMMASMMMMAMILKRISNCITDLRNNDDSCLII